MPQNIVHGYLYHCEGELIEAGGHSKGGDRFDTLYPGDKGFQFQMYGFIPGKIKEYHAGGKYLTDDSCPCSSGNSPAEGKNEQGVQYRIDQCTGDHDIMEYVGLPSARIR